MKAKNIPPMSVNNKLCINKQDENLIVENGGQKSFYGGHKRFGLKE